MTLIKRTYTASLLALAFGLAVSGYSQSFLTNGLVAYYPFNGNADDASGNGDNGAVIHATLVVDRFGISDHAYHFDGTSQIGIQATGAFLPVGSQARTISLWLNPDNLITNGSPTWISGGLFQYGIPSVGGGLCVEQFVLQKTPGLVSFYLGSESVWGWNSWLPSWNFSRWHHAVWTYDGYTNGVLYIDGNPVALASSSLGMTFNTQAGPLLIGVGAGRYFTGSLDDFRLYSRALSSAEVQQLYAYEGVPTVTLLKAVKPSFSNLYPGRNYKLQASDDLSTWYDQGPPFRATSTETDFSWYYDVDFWNQLYFRLQVVP